MLLPFRRNDGVAFFFIAIDGCIHFVEKTFLVISALIYLIP